jgi:hypothetical protein
MTERIDNSRQGFFSFPDRKKSQFTGIRLAISGAIAGGVSEED